MKFWRALCETLERPQWIERHWTRGLLPGSAESMALRAELAALFAGRTMAHWAERFEASMPASRRCSGSMN